MMARHVRQTPWLGKSQLPLPGMVGPGLAVLVSGVLARVSRLELCWLTPRSRTNGLGYGQLASLAIKGKLLWASTVPRSHVWDSQRGSHSGRRAQAPPRRREIIE
jgi:hypothetical protein